MLSRVADSVYWLSRYIERAENVSRFIEVNVHLTLDLPLDPVNQWEPLVQTTGDQELFKQLYDGGSREDVIEFLTLDERNPNSILSCVTYARENARSVREVISSEMWEQVNKFYLMMRDTTRARVLNAPHQFYTDVKSASHLFSGITRATLSHGEAWHFSQIGHHLERADKTSRILDVKYYILLPTVQDVGTPFDNIQWSAVLKSASALEMYRKTYGRISPEQVAEFLVLNRDFPRSIQHCLQVAETSINHITGSREGAFLNSAEQKLGRLRANLDFTTIEEIFNVGLHEYLDDFQAQLNDIDRAIFECFFTPRPVSGDVHLLDTL